MKNEKDIKMEREREKGGAVEDERQRREGDEGRERKI